MNSYGLPHHIHCSHIYPILAPNGSTLVVYGHDRGLRLLWRGGRLHKPHATASRQPESTTQQNLVVVDDSDDDFPQDQQNTGRTGDGFEPNEEEEDPDNPFASIIRDWDVGCGAAVLHIALPTIHQPEQLKLLTTHAIMAIACADGSTSVLQFPLVPPRKDEDGAFDKTLGEAVLLNNERPPYSLALKILLNDVGPAQEHQVQAQILVAASNSTLSVWNVNVEAGSIAKAEILPCLSLALPVPGVQLAFHPSSRSCFFFVRDSWSAVRIFEPLFAESSSRQTEFATTTSALAGSSGPEKGKWIMSYLPPFVSTPKDSPGIASRKRMVCCAWVLNGRAILSLLENGEWGIWDVFASRGERRGSAEFAVRGYLGSSASEVTESVKQKKTATKLAPMTPSTRKVKAETLFRGTSKATGDATNGGISVATIQSRSGQIDEHVVVWCGAEVYAIPSMHAFWQRSTNGGDGFGSLYAPGLAHIPGLNLMNENITSISVFPEAKNTAPFRHMNVRRDLLVSTEQRLLISQHMAPPLATKPFQQIDDRPAPNHISALDRGDLDFDRLNRLLGSGAADARTRKVGFAQ